MKGEFTTCAYTGKIWRFCQMMEPDWEIILYGSERNDAPCYEHVELISEKERLAWFGAEFDTTSDRLSWDPAMPYWLTFNARAIEEIAGRAEKQDLVVLSTGSQKLVADALRVQTKCEYGVGYEGIVTSFCAFESSSFMHTVYAKRGIEDGRDFDAVIPNFFDPEDFPILNDGSGDYLLYIGRVTRRKGPHVAAEVAKHAEMKLLVAGPGVRDVKPGRIEGDYVVLEGDHVEYVGEVGISERAELMAGARAVLAPTQYLEPFGGVAVEAQFCGTPAITTDFGAFRETVEHGVTGFRFRNLQQGLDAVERCSELDPETIRLKAWERFSLEAVKPQFEDWFDRLDSLWERGGWYAVREPKKKRRKAKSVPSAA